MENVEYGKMAYAYDSLYANKNYQKEVKFLTKFISNDKSVLDAGCGTGNHAFILSKLGYNVCGFDKSKEMVDIANQKLSGRFIVADLLNLKLTKKYDAAISMFAVFNHLKNYKEFAAALKGLKSTLNKGGVIIIDLHNPQKNGTKTDECNGVKRIMKWKKNKLSKTEKTEIKYIVNGKEYFYNRKFKIFSINKLKKLAKKQGFHRVDFYSNYSAVTPALSKSKNIQMVIYL